MSTQERVKLALPHHLPEKETLILEASCQPDGSIAVITLAPGVESDGPIGWRTALRVLVRLRYPYGDPEWWPTWRRVPRVLKNEIRSILRRRRAPEPCFDMIIAERRPRLGLKEAVEAEIARLAAV